MKGRPAARQRGQPANLQRDDVSLQRARSLCRGFSIASKDCMNVAFKRRDLLVYNHVETPSPSLLPSRTFTERSRFIIQSELIFRRVRLERGWPRRGKGLFRIKQLRGGRFCWHISNHCIRGFDERVSYLPRPIFGVSIMMRSFCKESSRPRYLPRLRSAS